VYGPTHPANALDRYRGDLSNLAPLDADTERDLALAFRRGDSNAGRKLLEASLPFVVRVAREYRRWGVPLEDLIQQGNLGLLKAAAKYEPGKNCRLITYAVYWIRAEIRDYVVRAYRRKGVEGPRELAEESGMPIARAQKLWPLLAQSDLSLDARYEDRSPAVERLRAEQATPEDEAGDRARRSGVRAAVGEALAQLSERERRIVEERLLTDEPRTLEQLGREMGVSKERIRQLEERARRKLREHLAEFHPQAA
jgi:RNA polymerase sigma-32 factor